MLHHSQSMSAHMAVMSRPVETGKPELELGMPDMPHWDGVADGARRCSSLRQCVTASAGLIR